MTIPPEDILVECWPPRTAESRGGQHVGSGPCGIKITHIPTGIIAICECMQSQHRNLTIAMDMILSAITHPKFR